MHSELSYMTIGNRDDKEQCAGSADMSTPCITYYTDYNI